MMANTVPPPPPPALSDTSSFDDHLLRGNFNSIVVILHVLCWFAPSTFSMDALGVAFMLYILTGVFGVTLSYHRNLSHKSFKLPKYLEYLFAYFGLQACQAILQDAFHGKCMFQGDPIFWVSTHRHHHKVSDTKGDPHSPIEGFMFSHIGWLFNFDKIVKKDSNYDNVTDLKRQSYYRFLKRTMSLHILGLGLVLYMLGGYPYVIWGMGVRTVWTYHITFAINSVCHTWGHQAWNTGDLSKNTWWLSLVSAGESWHNNHHAFEYSARQGLEWWQVDLTWYVIKLLECLGLATNVKLPSEKHMQIMSPKKNNLDKVYIKAK